MKISAYTRKARIYPTLLTGVPGIVLINLLTIRYFSDQLKDVIAILPMLVNLGLSAAFLFLLVQVNRFIAKELFQRFYFDDEMNMPTTNHLLWKDPIFNEEIKLQIRSKILSKYGIYLMGKSDEMTNEYASRKQIATAVSQIRNSLRGNKLLLQHNIEYGFFRNLIGGCVVAIIASIGILILGQIEKIDQLKILGVISLSLYIFPIFFSSLILKRYGNYYSKILFEQFLSL